MSILKSNRHIVFKGGFIILVCNIFSSSLGYLRDLLLMKLFGISRASDAWYVASVLPELFFKFLLFGAVGAVFIPVFVEYLKNGREGEAWDIASTVINASFIILALAVGLGIILASPLVKILAPGLDYQTHLLAVGLSRWVIPVVLTTAIAGLMGGVLRAYFHYFMPNFTPIVSAAVIIVFILFFSAKYGIFSIAMGTLAGGVASVLLVLFTVLFYRGKYSLRINFKHPAFGKIILLLIPLVAAEILGKSISVVGGIFASFAGKGAVTAFSLASRLVVFPSLFLPAAISVAIFPIMARDALDENKDNFINSLILVMRLSLAFILPIIVGFVIFSKPILAILFEHGKFSQEDTRLIWKVFILLSPALAAYSIAPFLSQACYALKKNWMIFRYELIGLILSVVLDFILLRFFGVAGIAMATTIVVSSMVLYLWFMIRRHLGNFPMPGIKRFLLKIAFASTVMGIFAYLFFHSWEACEKGSYLTRGMHVIVTAGLSALVYLWMLSLLKSKELTLLWKTALESMSKG